MIQNEQEIEKLDSVGLTLTTHRIRSIIKINNIHITSIMLDEVCSCEIYYSSNILFVIFGIAVLIGSIFVGLQITTWGYAGIIIALILFLIYFLDRGGIMIFSSAGAKIITPKKNFSVSQMLSFIDKVESAKNLRYFAKSDS